MIGVVGEVKRSVENVKDWIIRDLLRQQKPELDKKIDEMLKPPKINQIIQRYVGNGLGFGKRMMRLGQGKSIGKALNAIRGLL
jgi:hypothetical protein